jgi:hypothetical protein
MKTKLYRQLKGRNLIAAIEPMLEKGTVELRPDDGKIRPTKIRHTWKTPWIHHRPSYRHNCFLWNDLAWANVIPNLLPTHLRFVPSHCQNCYKVVCRPKTLADLFMLYDLQRGLDTPSKCGLEVRETVFGNYGGYWYTRGLEQGRERYKQVREAVDTHIGTDTVVLLKRGCTEYELVHGPSDKWEVSPVQEKVEELIESYFVVDIPFWSQQAHIKEHIKQIWIEQAYQLGDETVYQFIDQPLYPPYVTYHEKEEEEDV